MDNPHNASRIRRKNSLPAKLQRRASTLRTRLHMKSNPYVGSFRHSPPTSFRSVGGGGGGDDSASRRNNSSSDLRAWKATTMPLKSSPYVGWFRHAPPSKVKVHRVDPKHMDLLTRCQLLARTLEDFHHRNSKSNDQDTIRNLQELINGHLPGGGRDSEASKQVLQSIRNALDESSAESSSATVKVLARLGSWILFPLAIDAEKGRYTPCDAERIMELFPDHHQQQQQQKQPGKELLLDDDENASEGDSRSSSSSDDESTVLSDYDRCIPVSPSDPPPSRSSNTSSRNSIPEYLRSSISHDPLDISVSDIATAYYAHQISEEMGLFEDEEDGNERLDYVITQMDVARMARNASRHLDVDSIMNLPTITYQARQTTTAPPSLPEDSSVQPEEAWSWMMVQETRQPGATSGRISTVSNQVIEEEVDVCVICLEHFVQGDRLRLLPCNHSFHVGCIDRWLSGSHSYEACYTSGCPTCKKRPGDLLESSLDGSVPSWAFAQLGENLARASSSSIEP